MPALIGMDEAGMGTLAGPLTAAVVIIESDEVPFGVRDSKTLTWVRQESLAAEIMDAAIAYKIGYRSEDLIERFGLSACWDGLMTELAIYGDAVGQSCSVHVGDFVLDGNRLLSRAPYVTPVVKADRTHPAVSAASILAKYLQVCWMEDYDLMYPEYGFRVHHGYPTAEHLLKLEEFGPCPVHRKNYKPVKKAHLSLCGS